MLELKVLLVIAHPAHVHFFKNFIEEMEQRGHELALMVKERENTSELLELLGFDYEVFGKTYEGRLSKGVGVFLNDLSLLKKGRSFKPDITASIGGLYSVHVGKILGVPTIDFMDTEGARFTNMLTYPFADVIATPDCYRGPVPEKKHLEYAGYHELAYLHPKRFTPSREIIRDLDLQEKGYSVVRFSSLDASHQKGESVLNWKEKIRIVKELARYGEVLVDSEGRLPTELKRFEIDISSDRFHDLLAYAKLYVGEGATTASEAGVLGVPWIYVSSQGRCYLKDQQKRYGLGRQLDDHQKVLSSIEDMMEGRMGVDPQSARESLLRDKVDLTSWMVDTFEKFN